jgi:hypothetical protein
MVHCGHARCKALGADVSDGSKTVLTAPKRRFRVTPINGHRQTGAIAIVEMDSSGIKPER